MKTTSARSIDRISRQEQSRYYRIERQFSPQRQSRELVRDLLRAHSGA